MFPPSLIIWMLQNANRRSSEMLTGKKTDTVYYRPPPPPPVPLTFWQKVKRFWRDWDILIILGLIILSVIVLVSLAFYLDFH